MAISRLPPPVQVVKKQDTRKEETRKRNFTKALLLAPVKVLHQHLLNKYNPKLMMHNRSQMVPKKEMENKIRMN